MNATAGWAKRGVGARVAKTYHAD